MPNNPVQAEARALAARLGWSITCNPGHWIRLWDAQGAYHGKRQGWAAAYAYLAEAAERQGVYDPAPEGKDADGRP
ncbi:MAG: hypothetical protein K6U87_06175 [Firmicutes bacterium]|nr:hypothetical protein [Bacillota bacterium]